LRGAPRAAAEGRVGAVDDAAEEAGAGKRKKCKRADGGAGAAPRKPDAGGVGGGGGDGASAAAAGGDEALGVRLFRRVARGTPCSLVTPGERARRRFERAAAEAALAGVARSASERLLPPRLAPPDPCDPDGDSARAVELLGTTAAALARELADAHRAQRARAAAAGAVRLPAPGVVQERPRRAWVPHEARVARLLGRSAAR
jgi:hypothetical protein